MTQLDTTAYRDALLAQKDVIIEDLTAIATHNPVTDAWDMKIDSDEYSDADDNIMADEGEEIEERMATLALLETEYRNTMRALKKIETGTYGDCEICGNAIETERLEVEPGARTCTNHQDQEFDLPPA